MKSVVPRIILHLVWTIRQPEFTLESTHIQALESTFQGCVPTPTTSDRVDGIFEVVSNLKGFMELILNESALGNVEEN